MSDVVIKQRASVYTVMLVVSFLCLVVACLFLYFEMNQFEFMTKVPTELRAREAEKLAQAAEAAPAPAEVEMDPAAPMPMADPAAPMPDPAAPVADPAAPMANPAMPAEPVAP